MRNKIIYAGAFIFPDKNAAALRVRGIGKCLADIGYDVLYLGDQYDVNRPKESILYETDGYCYKTRPKWSSISFYKDIEHIVCAIKELGVDNVYAVILYHPPAIQAIKVKKYCDNHGIKVICDVTEWYDIKRQLSNGHMWIRAIDFWVRMYYVNIRIGNIIAISSYLEDYYKNRKCKTVKVPILLEKLPELNTVKDADILSLCYCGSPTKKDLLLPIVKAVENCVNNKKNISLDIVGTTQKEFEAINGYQISDEYQDRILFHGKVPHEQALSVLRKCDFSLIIRPSLRYAIAGFPTKMVEAFSEGVGVIATGNGDITSYVRTGVNGYIVDPDNAEKELISIIEEITKLPRSEINKIKETALKTAQEFFYYELYNNCLNDFLKRI